MARQNSKEKNDYIGESLEQGMWQRKEIMEECLA
jgi:hypothetical protein